MKSRKPASIITGIVVVVLLAPALIWSGKRAVDNAAGSAAVKQSEVSTVGPEVTPYVLTVLERDKLTLAAHMPPRVFDPSRALAQPAVVANDGPYVGMTPAELEKLAEWRAGRANVNDETPPGSSAQQGGRGGGDHE